MEQLYLLKYLMLKYQLGIPNFMLRIIETNVSLYIDLRIEILINIQ